MSDALSAQVLDALLDPLSHCFDLASARRVAAFEVDAAVQARVQSLAERANNGELDETERVEYEAFINVADLISILKLKAQNQLASNGG